MDSILGKKWHHVWRNIRLNTIGLPPYHPNTNGVVEAAKKNIMTIIEKMVESYND